MRDESPILLSPDPADLPLLFEVARILGRYASVAEALDPVLRLLEDRASLGGGEAILEGAFAPGSATDELIVVASSDASARLGRSVHLGDGLAGRAVAGARSIVQGCALAVPLVLSSVAVGALSFERAEGRRALIEATAALVAEALLLRRRLAHETEPLAAVSVASAPGGRGAEPSAGEEWAPETIIGRSAAMRQLYSLIDRVAATETTVLVTGESGTGKELVARALHDRSPRAKRPFVAVNCAAMPESLIESELFGHERGAFTGAQEQRRGRFELADSGTLFLDEIGELSPTVQAKLLRVLQEGEYQRVGGQSTLHTGARVIVATNRDLEKEVAEGSFRADLFWRLSVFPLRVPPLRERRSDIVLLADYFAEKHGRRAGKPVLRISSPAIDLLCTYHWPGNVRELENCIERAVVLSTDSVIHAYHLPPSLQSAESTGTGPVSTLDAALARLERELLVEALKLTRGNAAAAARRLGITERKMGLALHRYGIDWRRFRTLM
jgi:Nif-specific regulatory protein